MVAKKRVRAIKSEIEANAQVTKGHRKETGIHIDSLDPKEETNIQAEHNELKMRRGLGTRGTP